MDVNCKDNVVEEFERIASMVSDSEARRKSEASARIQQLQRDLGVILKPRVVIDGNNVSAGIVIEIDKEWVPSSSQQTKSESDSKQ